MQARRAEAETFRAALSGKTDSGGGWLRVQLEQPGVLLLRRLGPRRGRGSGGPYGCRNEYFIRAHIYACRRILTRAVSDFCQRSSCSLSVVLMANWIACYLWLHGDRSAG